MEWNYCGHLGIPINKILAYFDPVAVSGHLGFSIGSLSYFVSTRRPNAYHEVSIQLDYRDVQNMNSQPPI